MIVRGTIRRSAYFDSAALMQVQQALREFPGVQEAGVVMATPANLEMLRDAGLDPMSLAVTGAAARTAAGPNDLVVMVGGARSEQVQAALDAVDGLLVRRPAGADGQYRPRTVTAAARHLAGANLALVSVPGRFAAGVAREALGAGLHVMLFSDNVPLADEVRLKHAAAGEHRLMMGPDCGTAVLGGAALGFANRVRRGAVGLVGASGTGIQEIATLVHRFGGGVSQALGTGGRDLSAEVGGITARQGLAMLGRDPHTGVVVLVSKPPAPSVAAALAAEAASLGKPVVTVFLGAAPVAAGTPVYQAGTLEDAARLAVALGARDVHGAARPADGHPDAGVTLAGDRRALDRITARARDAVARLAPAQRYLRGLMSGGSLCAEAVTLLEHALRPLSTNVSAGVAEHRDGIGPSRGHTVLDLGADVFTVGRLHPMLDMTLRAARLRQEAADPEVAVVLLDVVLGLGVHADPAGALAPVIAEARAAAQAAGRSLAVVASVCGTDDDPQPRARQVARLEAAGVLVEESNARAALLAGAVAARTPGADALAGLLAAAPTQRPAGRVPAAVVSSGPRVAGLPPDADAVLAAPPHVVNVGLATFADSLRDQGVPVIDVDWRPPAGGDPELLDLLDRVT